MTRPTAFVRSEGAPDMCARAAVCRIPWLPLPSHGCPCYPYELHFDISRCTYAQVCWLSAVFHFCCCLLGSARLIEYAFRRQVLVGTREISGGRFAGRPQHGQRRSSQGASLRGGTTAEGRPRARRHGWLLPIHPLHAVPS